MPRTQTAFHHVISETWNVTKCLKKDVVNPSAPAALARVRRGVIADTLFLLQGREVDRGMGQSTKHNEAVVVK